MAPLPARVVRAQAVETDLAGVGVAPRDRALAREPLGPLPLGEDEAVLLLALLVLEADDDRPDALPHHWDITSDSLAARAAILAKARELILLKSADSAGVTDWSVLLRRFRFPL